MARNSPTRTSVKCRRWCPSSLDLALPAKEREKGTRLWSCHTASNDRRGQAQAQMHRRPSDPRRQSPNQEAWLRLTLPPPSTFETTLQLQVGGSSLKQVQQFLVAGASGRQLQHAQEPRDSLGCESVVFRFRSIGCRHKFQCLGFLELEEILQIVELELSSQQSLSCFVLGFPSDLEQPRLGETELLNEILVLLFAGNALFHLRVWVGNRSRWRRR